MYLAACDVPGIQRLLPDAWRKHEQFDAIHRLEAVPVATVQLRYDGWVTVELYPYIDNPDDAAREAREFLTSLMEELGIPVE